MTTTATGPARVDLDAADHARQRAEDAAAGPAGASRAPVSGEQGSAALLQTLLMGASHDVTFLVPTFDPSGIELSLDLAHHIRRRAGRLRLVVQRDVADIHEVQEHAKALGGLGVVPRVAESLPAYGLLVDGCAGIFGTQLVVAAAGLRRLRDHCDQVWRSSRPHPAASAQRYSGRSRQVIELLAQGLTDEAVARRLGVSVRTVRSDTASTMASFDASSRFQAGVRAAQLGLA